MFDETDRSFYRRRAREEREKVQMSGSMCARRTHEQLAAEYERRAEELNTLHFG